MEVYFVFLVSVVLLVRSNWIEFNLKLMGMGFCVMLFLFFLYVFSMKSLDNFCSFYFFFCGDFSNFFGMIFVYIVVLIRVCSFFLNSYIRKFSVYMVF